MPPSRPDQHSDAQPKPVVIGTAGHVDHGKSTLVKALTGIEPDRLAEEQARSMTIDLGFAWFTLPSGRVASIVDVPGHEHFIKNMLAGIGGIDLAMLVVAADEGPMPQTREHLAILDLLGIERGVVVLSRADLADAELLNYVDEEVRELLSGTTLADSPVVSVSAVTGAGIAELSQTIDRISGEGGQSVTRGPVRMPIDRVFTVQGFGTVVTGTVLGGSFGPGDEMVVMPAGHRVRVRGAQSHHRTVARVSAGMRAAINIAGTGDTHIRRGDVLTRPGALAATLRADLHLRLLADAPGNLTQNNRVDFFSGASESAGQLTMLESEVVEPGQTRVVQIRLARELALAAGDRFIVRQASPSLTIGGGVVLDPAPPRHRRFDPVVLNRLAGLVAGDPLTLVRNAVGMGIVYRDDVVAQVGNASDIETANQAVEELVRDDLLVVMGEIGHQFLIDSELLANMEVDARRWLEAFHRRHPLRPGMELEEFRTMTGFSAKEADALVATLEARNVLVREGSHLRLPTYRIVLAGESQRRADAFLDALRLHPHDPPSPHESGVDHELLLALEHLGRVVRLSEAMAFDPLAHASLTETLRDYLAKHGTISLAEFRDLVGTTRKYAQPLLEDFDRRRLTRRVGEVRVPGPAMTLPSTAMNREDA